MEKPKDFDRLVQNATFMADGVAINDGPFKTQAEFVGKVTERVLQFAVQNKLIEITPSEDWPFWLDMCVPNWTANKE